MMTRLWLEMSGSSYTMTRCLIQLERNIHLHGWENPYKSESVGDLYWRPFPLKHATEAVEFERHNCVYLNWATYFLCPSHSGQFR